MFPNKFDKKCKICNEMVRAGQGFVRNEGGTWTTYCKPHAPEKIEAPKPAELSLDGFIFNTPYAIKDVIKALPGARWNPDKKAWQVSLNLADRQRLLEVCRIHEILVPEELKEIPQTENAKMAEGKGLYPYQVNGVNWLSLQEHAILGDDMGLGKTVQVLCALPKDAKVILVCPSALKYNWVAETKKWNPNFKCTVLKTKQWKFPEEGEIVITNYESLPDWLKDSKKEGDKYPTTDVPDEYIEQLMDCVLVCDECQKVKNPKAKMSNKIRILSHTVQRVWFLTGTPMTNRPPDLYGILKSMGTFNKVFGSYDRFKTLFNAEDRQVKKGIWITEWGMPTAEVPERLRRVMLRRLKKDVLKDLPPKTYHTITVNGLDRSLVNEMDEMWATWLEMGGNDDELPPFEMFSGIRAKIAEAKTPALIELVETYEESETPILVFSAHRYPILEVGKREGWETITGDTKPEKRQQIVDAFQAGKLKGVALTITAGGVGLTLTRASTVIFCDKDWTPGNNVQAEDRVCRIGQTANSVEIISLDADHVLDQHVNKLINWKTELFRKAIEESVGKVDPSKIIPETAEQYAERMKEAENEEKESKKRQAKEKVQRILRSVRGRKDVVELDVNNPERKEQIKSALQYMQSVCDGAEERDGMGFSKPDAFYGHWLNATELENEQELSATLYLLQGYHRQLSGHYPKLFKE